MIHTLAVDNANSKAVAAKLGARYLRQARVPEPLPAYEVEVGGRGTQHGKGRR